MNSRYPAEQSDIYRLFRQASQNLEVEFDTEGVWFFEEFIEKDGEESEESEGQREFNQAVDKITKEFKNAQLGTSYREIKTVVAIAICDSAELEIYEDEMAGGWRYEDD